MYVYTPFSDALLVLIYCVYLYILGIFVIYTVIHLKQVILYMIYV